MTLHPDGSQFCVQYLPYRQPYRQPFGAHLRYFLEDRDGRLLGCLLYDFAALRLPVSDRWIGWQDQPHRRHLDRLVRQARFLLLPWGRVQCLASKALVLSLRQLAHDWQRAHGVRPVLVETYVDPQRHKGTCYRASNWRYLGQTQARGAWGGAPAKTPKAVFVYPLQRDWQAVLLGPPLGASRDLSPAWQRLCEPLCLWPCPATAAPCLHPYHKRNPGYSAPTRLREHLLARPPAPRLLNGCPE